jgi:hypothetical protein
LVGAVEFVGAVGFDVPHATVAIASALQTAMILTDIFILGIQAQQLLSTLGQQVRGK